MSKQTKFELAQKVTRAMISDTEVELRRALEKESWFRAGDLASYLAGMQQIEIIFNQAWESKKEKTKEKVND